ncbi:MAG: hypothetical protein D6744_05845, partial [Planctomycetota bacterium]
MGPAGLEHPPRNPKKTANRENGRSKKRSNRRSNRRRNGDHDGPRSRCGQTYRGNRERRRRGDRKRRSDLPHLDPRPVFGTPARGGKNAFCEPLRSRCGSQ